MRGALRTILIIYTPIPVKLLYSRSLIPRDNRNSASSSRCFKKTTYKCLIHSETMKRVRKREWRVALYTSIIRHYHLYCEPIALNAFSHPFMRGQEKKCNANTHIPYHGRFKISIQIQRPECLTTSETFRCEKTFTYSGATIRLTLQTDCPPSARSAPWTSRTYTDRPHFHPPTP